MWKGGSSMFFSKQKNQQESTQLLIHAERSSVCMGDDCYAPNPEDLSYEPEQTLSEFIPMIARYVPKMKDSWWDVYTGKQLVATVYFNGCGKVTYELHGPDIRIADMAGEGIFCRYHYKRK